MNLKSQIESLLFISAKPMTSKQLAEIIKVEPEALESSGDELVADYQASTSGIQIIKSGNKYQMVSAPENAQLVQEFIKDETTGELSRPSLETLTIIAYRGPISKLDLDRIRGVNCSLILKNLLLRGLIEAKPDKKKGETYYSVTMDFIRFLGINDLKQLPDYDKLRMDDNLQKIMGDAAVIDNGAAPGSGESDPDEDSGMIADASGSEQSEQDTVIS